MKYKINVFVKIAEISADGPEEIRSLNLHNAIWGNKKQPETISCANRGSELQYQGTSYVNRGNELQFKRTSCINRKE